MYMDFQDVPITNLTEKQRKESEAIVRKFVQENNEKVQQEIKKLRAAGYSDREIEESFAF
jgi:hypothetical protein